MNCSVPTDVVVKAWNAIEVVFDAPKNAVPVGTVAGVQLAAVLKFELPGAVDHVASCARAGNAASNATAAVVVSKCARIAPPPVQKRPNTRMPQDASANWATHQPLVEISCVWLRRHSHRRLFRKQRAKAQTEFAARSEAPQT